MKKNTELSESLEDYLEVILNLEQTNKVARAKDIAQKLGIQRGSVTGALKSLEEKDLINYEPYSFITLTRKGAKIAREITQRHKVLKDFLFRVLQVDSEKAEAMACRMEHAVDQESIDKLVQFIDFIYSCPRTGDDWVKSFVNYCSSKEHEWKECEECLDKCKVRHKKNKN